MRKIAVLTFGLLVLHAVPASAAPVTVVRTGTCSDSARWRLELTDMGIDGPIKVRFEVHRSPPAHTWRIRVRISGGNGIDPPVVAFRGTRTADDGGEVVLRLRIGDRLGFAGHEVEATDTQTGQVCRAFARV